MIWPRIVQYQPWPPIESFCRLLQETIKLHIKHRKTTNNHSNAFCRLDPGTWSFPHCAQGASRWGLLWTIAAGMADELHVIPRHPRDIPWTVCCLLREINHIVSWYIMIHYGISWYIMMSYVLCVYYISYEYVILIYHIKGYHLNISY